MKRALAAIAVALLVPIVVYAETVIVWQKDCPGTAEQVGTLVTCYQDITPTPTPTLTPAPPSGANLVVNPNCIAEHNSADIPGWLTYIPGTWRNSFYKNPSPTGDACKKWPDTPADSIYQVFSGPATYFEITHIQYRAEIRVLIDGEVIWSDEGATRIGSGGPFDWITESQAINVGPGEHLLEVWGYTTGGLKFLGLTLR